MISIKFVEENLRQLMANKKVSFIQLYVCIEGVEHPGTNDEWDFSNWYSFVHIKGGQGTYKSTQDIYEYIEQYFPTAELDRIWICEIQFRNPVGDLITIGVDTSEQ